MKISLIAGTVTVLLALFVGVVVVAGANVAIELKSVVCCLIHHCERHDGEFGQSGAIRPKLDSRKDEIEERKNSERIWLCFGL